MEANGYLYVKRPRAPCSVALARLLVTRCVPLYHALYGKSFCRSPGVFRQARPQAIIENDPTKTEGQSLNISDRVDDSVFIGHEYLVVPEAQSAQDRGPSRQSLQNAKAEVLRFRRKKPNGCCCKPVRHVESVAREMH